MYRQEFIKQLNKLEKELRHLNWWQENPPNPEALQSKEPFCVDTLNFSEWLQWVYLPKIKNYLQTNPLPPKPSCLLPMAEEAWRGLEVETITLRETIAHIDQLSNH